MIGSVLCMRSTSGTTSTGALPGLTKQNWHGCGTLQPCSHLLVVWGRRFWPESAAATAAKSSDAASRCLWRRCRRDPSHAGSNSGNLGRSQVTSRCVFVLVLPIGAFDGVAVDTLVAVHTPVTLAAMQGTCTVVINISVLCGTGPGLS